MLRSYAELLRKTYSAVVREYVEGKARETEEVDSRKLVFNSQVRWLIAFGVIVCAHAWSRTVYNLHCKLCR